MESPCALASTRPDALAGLRCTSPRCLAIRTPAHSSALRSDTAGIGRFLACSLVGVPQFIIFAICSPTTRSKPHSVLLDKMKGVHVPLPPLAGGGAKHPESSP